MPRATAKIGQKPKVAEEVERFHCAKCRTSFRSYQAKKPRLDPDLEAEFLILIGDIPDAAKSKKTIVGGVHMWSRGQKYTRMKARGMLLHFFCLATCRPPGITDWANRNVVFPEIRTLVSENRNTLPPFASANYMDFPKGPSLCAGLFALQKLRCSWRCGLQVRVPQAQEH